MVRDFYIKVRDYPRVYEEGSPYLAAPDWHLCSQQSIQTNNISGVFWQLLDIHRADSVCLHTYDDAWCSSCSSRKAVQLNINFLCTVGKVTTRFPFLVHIATSYEYHYAIPEKGDWKRPPTPYVKGLTSGEALRVIIALANNYMEDCARVLYPWFLALLSTRDHSGPGRYLREVSLYHWQALSPLSLLFFQFFWV